MEKVKHAYSTDYARGLDDLEANRAGFIPIGQKDWLRRRWLRHQLPQFIFGVLLILTFAAVLWFIQISPRWDEEATLLAGVIVAIALALAAYLIIDRLRLEGELRRGIVSEREGRVTLNAGDGFNVLMGVLEFKVSQDMYLSFNTQDTYRLYYTPQSKVLLTAEKLSDE